MAYSKSNFNDEKPDCMACRRPPPITTQNMYYDRRPISPQIKDCYDRPYTTEEMNNLKVWQDPNMFPVFPALSVKSSILCDHFENRFAKETFEKKHFYDTYTNDCVNQGFLCNWCAGNYNVGERSGSLMRCRQCGRLDYSETEGKVANAFQFPSA